MTQIAINQQIDAIRKVTEEAIRTKESALKFLKDAGILQDAKETSPKVTAKKGK